MEAAGAGSDVAGVGVGDGAPCVHSLALSHAREVRASVYYGHTAVMWVMPTAALAAWACFPFITAGGSPAFGVFAYAWHPLLCLCTVVLLPFALWFQSLPVLRPWAVAASVVGLLAADAGVLRAVSGALQSQDALVRRAGLATAEVAVLAATLAFVAACVWLDGPALADGVRARAADPSDRAAWSRRTMAAHVVSPGRQQRGAVMEIEGPLLGAPTLPWSGPVDFCDVRCAALCIVKITLLAHGMFVYCLVFTWLYVKFATGNPALQVGMHAVFQFPIFVAGLWMSRLGGEMDEVVLDGRKAVKPALKLLSALFQEAFNKNLFTSVTSYPTLVAFEIILVAQMVVAFPLCMTRRCLRARTTMRARLNGTAFWFLAAAIPRGSYAEARESLTQNFFFLSMAQRIAMTGFIVSLVVLRHGPNAAAFPASGGLSEAQYSLLLQFAAVMACTDWLVSTVIHFVIYFAHGLDSTRVGGRAVVNCRLTGLCCVIALMVLFDAVASLLDARVA